MGNRNLRRYMQGGLPTFMDVGSSFSAAAVTEDNLVDQLRSHGKKLVCMTMLLAQMQYQHAC